MKYIILFIISISLFACESGLPTDGTVRQLPKNLLSKEDFTELYYDAQLTEAAIRIEIGKGANSKEISKYMYQQLFKKHQITEQDFEDNLKYYASDPIEMQEIQTKVVNRLSKKEAELTNQ